MVYNPEQAKKDKATRERNIGRIEEEIEAMGDLEGRSHSKAACELLSHPYLGRYVKELKNGRLRVNHSKLADEEELDGKYLLFCSDDTITGEEIPLGYKQLYEVERAFRTLKTTLELRPAYHRKDERIRNHVTLCWLAYPVGVDESLFKGINRLENPQDQSELAKLHVPFIKAPEKVKAGEVFPVEVTIGKILHPMKPVHWIEHVQINIGNEPAGTLIFRFHGYEAGGEIQLDPGRRFERKKGIPRRRG